MMFLLLKHALVTCYHWIAQVMTIQSILFSLGTRHLIAVHKTSVQKYLPVVHLMPRKQLSHTVRTTRNVTLLWANLYLIIPVVLKDLNWKFSISAQAKILKVSMEPCCMTSRLIHPHLLTFTFLSLCVQKFANPYSTSLLMWPPLFLTN